MLTLFFPRLVSLQVSYRWHFLINIFHALLFLNKFNYHPHHIWGVSNTRGSQQSFLYIFVPWCLDTTLYFLFRVTSTHL